MNLRPYQNETIQSVRRGWSEFRRQLIELPTGAGKTVVFCSIAKEFVDRGQRVLILAHREELVSQAQDKLTAVTGLSAAREMAEDYAPMDSQIVVGSIQTMCNRKRLLRWAQDHFDLIICDEAHHSISDSWQAVLQYFTSAKVLGVTATPDRGDKKNLGRFYDNLAASVTIKDLILDGYLSRIKTLCVPIDIDLRGVGMSAGDYKAGDLGEAIQPYLEAVADAIKTHAFDRRTLVFLPLIQTSQQFVDILQSIGVSACHVDGRMKKDERSGILDSFRAYNFQVLCNSMLLTEGYDDPGIDCLCVLRPTRSRSLYAQMIGRGTRPHPLKDDLLILDPMWLHEEHSLIKPGHLISDNLDMVSAMDKKATSRKEEQLDLLETESNARAEREAALAKKFAENAKRKSQLLDPIEFAIKYHFDDIEDYEANFKWEEKKPTEKQLAYIEKLGINPDSVTDRGQASRIINRSNDLPASQKQRWAMKAAGVPHWDTATRSQAREFFQMRGA